MLEDVAKRVEDLSAVASVFMQSQVILVANEYDLFTKIDGRSLTVDEVAATLQTDPRPTRMLLDVLAGMGYLEKSDNTYRNSEVSKELLVAGSPYYQGDSLRHRYRLWFSWSTLREVMRTGLPADDLTIAFKEPEAQTTRHFILAMANSALISVEQVLEKLDLTGVTTLLDLGGGPGSYAIAFAKKYPQLRATVFDLPDPCSIAQEQIERAKVAHRVTTHAGDFLKDDIGRGYDMVFLSNIIHSHSPDDIQLLLSKCFHALNPGGRIVVKDFLTDDDRSGPLFTLLFAINMLVNTQAGDTYTFTQVEGWLKEAGFGNLRQIQLTEQAWMVEAAKAEPL
ncbi:MAG: methyltransferase [bacterium]